MTYSRYLKTWRKLDIELSKHYSIKETHTAMTLLLMSDHDFEWVANDLNLDINEVRNFYEEPLKQAVKFFRGKLDKDDYDLLPLGITNLIEK